MLDVNTWLAVSILIHPKTVLSGCSNANQVLQHQIGTFMSIWTLPCPQHHIHTGIVLFRNTDQLTDCAVNCNDLDLFVLCWAMCNITLIWKQFNLPCVSLGLFSAKCDPIIGQRIWVSYNEVLFIVTDIFTKSKYLFQILCQTAALFYQRNF